MPSGVDERSEPWVVFRHCPRCGARGLKRHATYGFSCPGCGFLFFQNVAAAAAALVLGPDGRVLLARRAHEPAAGMLDVPGGFVDYGETAEEALRRELREELALEFDEPVYFGTIPNVYQYCGLNYRTLDVYFTVRPGDFSALRPADDITSAEWRDLTSIDPAELAFDSVRRALAELRARRPGR